MHWRSLALSFDRATIRKDIFLTQCAAVRIACFVMVRNRKATLGIVMKTVLYALLTSLMCVTLSPAYSEEAVLTISGNVAEPETGSVWHFTLSDLEALPATTIETTTIWTEGLQGFEGVLLADLLDHVSAESGTILAVALNDYAVKIPTSDATEIGPIVAYKRGGDILSVRDRGPLWIIYPFDGNEIYRSEEYYSRSIWQLNRIEIVTEDQEDR